MQKDEESLQRLVVTIAEFLDNHLKLKLHPDKTIFRMLDWGIDFLGYIILPHYRLPKTKTKRRLFRKLELKRGSPNYNQSLQSYLGYLGHANAYKMRQELVSLSWIFLH